MTSSVMQNAQVILNLLKNDLAWIHEQRDPNCNALEARCERHGLTYTLHMTNIYAEEVTVDLWDSETVGVAHTMFFQPHLIGASK